jgi:hypothetical protein
MKASEILLEAAIKADRGDQGACYSINSSNRNESLEKEFLRRTTLHLFVELLEPHQHDSTYWWGYPFNYYISDVRCSEEDHNARILGILFAYEVAKDDEKRKRKA